MKTAPRAPTPLLYGPARPAGSNDSHPKVFSAILGPNTMNNHTVTGIKENPLVRSANWALAALTAVNLLNYLDRYVVSALVETLKKSELHLNDTQAGLLMTGFIIVYMLASPVFGAIGDRIRRPRLISFGVAIWSVATLLGGFVSSFAQLFGARALVGIGEAAYGTLAPPLLADYFSPSLRGRMYAIFFSAIPVGSALGYVLGGIVDQHWGWRAAFFIAGAPGILLALLVLFVGDPPRGAKDVADFKEPVESASEPAAAQSTFSRYFELTKNRAFLFLVLGYAAQTFGLGGLAFWMPAFLERARGLPRQEASVIFGGIVVVTGFVGTFVGGWLGDRLLKRTEQAYAWLCGISMLIAFPFGLMALISPQPAIYWSGMILAELLLFLSMGPINSAIINAVHPMKRAIAVAACNFTIHILGDVPSPPLIGFVSDHSSLEKAVLLVPASMVISGLIWSYAAWSGERAK